MLALIAFMACTGEVDTEDTGGHDTAPDDTAGDTAPDDTAGDTAPDDTAGDTALDDTGPDDTGPGDTGPGDTSSGDTAPDDTGPDDTGPDDTGGDTADACAGAVVEAGSWTIRGPDTAADLCAGGPVDLVGDVSILETDLTDLSALACVCSVGGSLTIRGNPSLTSLRGLENLHTVGEILIRDNVGLLSLDGLDGLETVTGDFTVTENPALATIGGLTALEAVHGELTISENALTDLEGLGVRTVGGLHLEAELALTSLRGLEHLTSVEDTLYLRSCNALVDLDGLGALASADTIELWRNDGLVTLAGLDGLEALRVLDVEEHAALATFGTASAVSIEEVVIFDNGALADFDGFPAPTVGGILLWGSPIPNLSPLAGRIAADAGYVVIGEMNALTTLDGLDAVRTIGYELYIGRNALLADVSALHGVTSVAYDLTVAWNPSLASADAEALRDSIRSVGGTVLVTGNGP